MKTLKATVFVEVPDDVVTIMLNPIQQLTGRVVKEKVTAEGLPDVRETIPCSITPILFLEGGYVHGKLEPVAKEFKPEPKTRVVCEAPPEVCDIEDKPRNPPKRR